MKGSSGMVAYTRSVAAILARAGLASAEEAEQVARSQQITMERPVSEDWRTQSRRGQRGGGHGQRDQGQSQGRRDHRGRRQQQQVSPFQLATQNRWSAFQGNL